ncbi:hypothetical protein ACXET9_12385 [Brachybacterium sp. DNPG3]
MDILVLLIIYGLLAAVIALTLYWVIRRGVADGIRDARADEERRQQADERSVGERSAGERSATTR